MRYSAYRDRVMLVPDDQDENAVATAAVTEWIAEGRCRAIRRVVPTMQDCEFGIIIVYELKADRILQSIMHGMHNIRPIGGGWLDTISARIEHLWYARRMPSSLTLTEMLGAGLFVGYLSGSMYIIGSYLIWSM